MEAALAHPRLTVSTKPTATVASVPRTTPAVAVKVTQKPYDSWRNHRGCLMKEEQKFTTMGNGAQYVTLKPRCKMQMLFVAARDIPEAWLV